MAKAVEKLGAGELLVNCIDEGKAMPSLAHPRGHTLHWRHTLPLELNLESDGQGNGFDVDLMAEMRRSVAIPVVASSGAGNTAHFVEVPSSTQPPKP